MSWIPVIEQWIVHLATQVPLPAYVFVGEIIEELISPIPSQAVLMTAGSIAKTQDLPITGLFLLAVIATIAKTAATFFYYVLADKMEDRLLPRFGKYIGITHEQVEAIGKRLDRGGMKEVLSLFLIRCLPILPSAPVSAICGLLKIGKKNFLLATLGGNFVRSGLMLLTGYLGFDVLGTFLKGRMDWTTLLIIIVLSTIIGLFAWGYWKRYKHGLN
jgi:membrane protein DedA with SNARE-associated domain